MSDKKPPPQTPFQKFEELARKVVAVPKRELTESEKAWKSGKRSTGSAGKE